jgi:hypothetical protein
MLRKTRLLVRIRSDFKLKNYLKNNEEASIVYFNQDTQVFQAFLALLNKGISKNT